MLVSKTIVTHKMVYFRMAPGCGKYVSANTPLSPSLGMANI